MLIQNNGGHIVLTDVPEALCRLIEKQLALKNPMYAQLLRMGNTRALYGMKEYIPYYKKLSADSYLIGRGCLDPIMEYCGAVSIPCKYTDKSVSIPFIERFEPISEREYQIGVIDEIVKAEQGIVKLSTGYGKSILALNLIARLNQKALIVVPRDHLLKQFVQDIKQFLGVDAGIIQGKECTIKGITVATMQTLDRLCKKRKLNEIADKFGIIIYDEVHTTITKSRLDVIMTFHAKYLYGFTATPTRTDGQGEAIGFTFGKILIDRQLPHKLPKVEVYQNKIDIPVREYHLMIEDQVENRERNELIAQLALDKASAGHKVLIITKRIAHAQMIKEYLPEGDDILIIEATDKNKAQILDDFRKDKIPFKIILATAPLIAVGTDIPALSCLIIACDLKSTVLSVQAIGRCLRLHPDKLDPLIVDVDDSANGVLHRQAKHRQKLYTMLEYSVDIIKPDERNEHTVTVQQMVQEFGSAHNGVRTEDLQDG